jgi:hypothetical protein
MSSQEFINTYAITKHRVTGVVYSLVHGRRQKLDLLKLAQYLEGTTRRFSFKPEDDETNIIIPDVFKKKGEVILQSKIDKVVLTNTSLFGKATVDAPIRIKYRQKVILIVGTTDIYFMIFRDEPSKKYFLVVLSSRKKSNELFATLSENLKNYGLAACPSKIDHEDIQEITKRLKGKLKFTLIGNFPTAEITKKGIWGNDFVNDPSYKEDIEVGSIYQNQFQFKDEHNENRVITVSDDGLIRFYNNISCEELEWFIRREIVPFIKLAKKPEIPALAGFTFEDLFVDEV